MRVRIAPGVVIDGITIYPPGWMYIFALAIGGSKWAEEQVGTPEFDKQVREWFKDQERADLDEQIAHYEAELAKVKARRALLPTTRQDRIEQRT